MYQQILLLSLFFNIILVIQVNSYPLALHSVFQISKKHFRRAKIPIEEILETSNSERSGSRSTIIPHVENRELIPVSEREGLPRQGSPVGFREQVDREHNLFRPLNEEVNRRNENDLDHHDEDFEDEDEENSEDSSYISSPVWQAWSHSDEEDIDAMPLYDDGQSTPASSEVIDGDRPESHRWIEILSDTGDSHRDKRFKHS
ncbi:secreted protein [Melampsora americana]|nr:secreted protein [Melampsora americana]